MKSILADLRAAARSYVKTPLVAVGVVVSLALGVGTAATVLNLVDVLLLRPPDVPQPQELVGIYSRTPDDAYIGSSFADFRDFQRRNQSLVDLAAYLRASVSMEGGSGSREGVQAEVVSGNYFDVLRLRPEQGRLLTPADDVASAAPAVVVSHQFWREHFTGALDAHDRTLRINGISFAIVGVAPQGFSGLTEDWGPAPHIWLPVVHLARAIPMFSGKSFLETREFRSFLLVGRLRPGVEPTSAHADFGRVTQQLAREFPDTNERWSAIVLPAKYTRFWVGHRPTVELVLAVMSALALLVWLVACANAATLLTTKMLGRRREFLIRHAVGASRARLAGQLVLEGLMLAVPSALLAASCTVILSSALEAGLSPFRIPIRLELSLDPRSVALVVGFSAVSGLLLVLLSAVSALRGTGASLHVSALLGDRGGEGAGAQRGPFSLRRLLVFGQVAGAATLLIVSTLLLRSVARLHDVDTGFDSNAPVLMTSIDLSVSDGVADDPGAARALRRDLLERLRGQPGVEAVSVADRPPLSIVKAALTLAADGSLPERSVPYTVVSSDYFRTIGLPLLAGRSFRETDAGHTSMPVVVNQLLAAQLTPDGLPLGRHLTLRLGDESFDAQIIAVAKNATTTLMREAPEPHVYVPHTHVDRTIPTVLLRTAMPAGRMADVLRRTMRALDPRFPAPKPTTLRDTVEGSMAQERLLAWAAAGSALVAIALAVLGLYGLTTYFVIQRRRELGIRMAMGASRRDVMHLVLRQGLIPALVGVLVGLVVAATASTALASFVYGVGVRDPASYIGVALLLLGVTTAACIGAVRRAWTIDPASLLRTE